MDDYKILQIIPAPDDINIYIDTADSNGDINRHVKKPVCLALVEDEGKTTIMAVECNLGYFEPCVQRFSTDQEIIQDGEVRVTIGKLGE